MTAQAHQKSRIPWTGPTSGLPSGENVKGPLTTFLMPTRARAGKVLESALQLRRDAVEIVGQELVVEVVRRHVGRPDLAGLFVRPEQHP